MGFVVGSLAVLAGFWLAVNVEPVLFLAPPVLFGIAFAPFRGARW